MDTKELINLLIKKAKSAVSDTTVIFLANVKDVTSV